MTLDEVKTFFVDKWAQEIVQLHTLRGGAFDSYLAEICNALQDLEKLNVITFKHTCITGWQHRGQCQEQLPLKMYQGGQAPPNFYTSVFYAISSPYGLLVNFD